MLRYMGIEKHHNLFLTAWVLNFIEWYEVGVLYFTLPHISTMFPHHTLNIILHSMHLLRPLGIIVFAVLANFLSVPLTFLICTSFVVVAGIGTGAMVWFPDIFHIYLPLFVIFRILQTLSSAAELPLAILLITNHSQPATWPRYIAHMLAGVAFSILVAFFTVHMAKIIFSPVFYQKIGFSIPFFLILLVFLVVIYIKHSFGFQKTKHPFPRYIFKKIFSKKMMFSWLWVFAPMLALQMTIFHQQYIIHLNNPSSLILTILQLWQWFVILLGSLSYAWFYKKYFVNHTISVFQSIPYPFILLFILSFSAHYMHSLWIAVVFLSVWSVTLSITIIHLLLGLLELWTKQERFLGLSMALIIPMAWVIESIPWKTIPYFTLNLNGVLTIILNITLGISIILHLTYKWKIRPKHL